MDGITELIHDFLIISKRNTLADVKLWVNSNINLKIGDTEIVARLIILKSYFEDCEEYEICAKIQHIIQEHDIKNTKHLQTRRFNR